MKIQKKRKNKSMKARIACLVAVLILVGAGVYYFVVVRSGTDSNQTDKQGSASTDQPSEKDKATQADKNAKQKEDYLNSNPDEGTPPAETSSSDDISMVISQSGDKVVVSTNLGYISKGTCKLTVGSYSNTVNIMYQPAYSTCMGFSIDRNQLQTGNNTFKLEVSYDNVTLTKTESADIK
ncbi:MAG: hypothetical protein LBL84_01990 [Candidatus Nomurabacteria bacterium]|jgi:flagellar basal body-associated protein FliL|nr:hypothetical protein [Candidatus Nomurabacteria bacterium]